MKDSGLFEKLISILKERVAAEEKISDKSTYSKITEQFMRIALRYNSRISDVEGSFEICIKVLIGRL